MMAKLHDMRSVGHTVTLALVLLGLARAAAAWDGTGHQIVCLIAEDHLSTGAKAAARELLDGGNISDAEACNWADEVRRQRRQTAPWHYVNIPFDADRFDRSRDAKDGNNVIDAIDEQAHVLADRSASHERRAEALKFLIHFVGDVHQPMHCVDRDGDRGGNRRLVFFPDRRKAIGLHEVWDGLILRRAMNGRRVAEYAEQLQETVDVKRLEMWTGGTAELWANESHTIAKQHAYRDIPPDGDPPRLTAEYLDESQKVVNERLLRAGVRLAALLEKCLAGSPTDASPTSAPADSMPSTRPSGRSVETRDQDAIALPSVRRASDTVAAGCVHDTDPGVDAKE